MAFPNHVSHFTIIVRDAWMAIRAIVVFLHTRFARTLILLTDTCTFRSCIITCRHTSHYSYAVHHARQVPVIYIIESRHL